MKQKAVILCFLIVILIQINLYAQSNGLEVKDIYRGPNIMALETRLVKETNINLGIVKYYLEFNNSNQYILKQELENILKDKNKIISFRDKYIFSDKNTILKYYLNSRGVTLLITFSEDESSRCEIYFNNSRQMFFEIKDLEILFKDIEKSIDIMSKID